MGLTSPPRKPLHGFGAGKSALTPRRFLTKPNRRSDDQASGNPFVEVGGHESVRAHRARRPREDASSVVALIGQLAGALDIP